MLLLSPTRRWVKVFIAATVLFPGLLLLYNRAQSFKSRRHEIVDIELSTVDENDANGFIKDLRETERFCEKHNLDIFPERKYRRNVYDLFMINGELDWLDIRLNELVNYVDYFVILECETTFTGRPKPLHMKENWERYSAFHDKIIYRVLNKTGFVQHTTWDLEDFQRNAMLDQVFPELSGVQRARLGDVIIVSDIDEIPRPKSLQVLRNCRYPRRLTLRSRFYYYGFQWLHRGEDWSHPQATFYEGDDTIRPANLRNGEGGNIFRNYLDKADLRNAAWHCSSCFATLDDMLNKMSSFSHTRWDTPEFRDKERIVRLVRNGMDLFDRKGEFYDRLDSNTDTPIYVLSNRDKFAYLLDRDPPNANFRDYNVNEGRGNNDNGGVNLEGNQWVGE